jgi:hypothetical protein
MFSQPRVRSALLSIFAALALLVISAGTARVSNSQATTSSSAGASHVAAALPCNLITPFNASNFPSSPNVNNPLLPYVPGTEFILEGRINVGGQPLNHQVILIVTDLTKMVHGVRTVVLWDRDFNSGVLAESELAFHAQDNAGNIWDLGEYPAQYSGGHFTDAPDTWISGLDSAQGGTIIPGNPQTGTPVFLQAYAPNIIGDCGQVASVGQQVTPICVPVGCYTNMLVVDETSPGEPGTQQKFYTPGVGNFKIGATDNDPQGETLVLSETLRLSRDDCIAARQAALALEDQAYNHDTSQTVYAQTTPMEQTGLCDALQPTLTPTRTPTGTPPTSTPTRTPTGTPATSTPTRTPTPPAAPGQRVYMPVVAKNVASTVPPTPTSSPTPTLPPAVFNNCKDDPNPASAPNFPVRIVKVDKGTEVVTLQNVSTSFVSVEDWNMCSINGNQEHDQIFGTLAPGQVRDFPNTGGSPIWNDSEQDDGALYNAAGFLVSYWVDK